MTEQHRRPAPRQAIVFSWDRTLVQSSPLVVVAFRQATYEVLGDSYPTSPAEIELVTSMPISESSVMLVDDPEAALRMSQRYHQLYRELCPVMLRPMPEARATLHELRERGFLLGVVTVKSETRLVFDIDCCGFGGLIDCYVNAKEGETSADPSPIVRCLDLLQVAPTNTMFVASRMEEVAAAYAAGIERVALAPDLARSSTLDDATYALESLSELTDLSAGW